MIFWSIISGIDFKVLFTKRIKKFFKAQSNIPVNDDNEIELNISSVDNITSSVMKELCEPLLDESLIITANV